VVQKARWMEKWGGHGNWFNNILIQGDQSPPNNTWVCQQGYCPCKLLYSVHFSDRINTGEADPHVSASCQIVHHELLFVDDLEYQLSAMLSRTYGMIMRWDAPQSVHHFWNDSSVLTPGQLVPSGEENQSLLNRYASLESYNMIH
jgi:hypothetical protein